MRSYGKYNGSMHKDQTGRVLWVIATPIGNLEDLSPRARRILSEVDWIAAEDTRHTQKLLASQGIEKQLHSLHEHSTENRVAKLVEKLNGGESGAYVSDAGTPGISDPGADLVKAAREAGVKVLPVPGPSAPVTLLSVCGFSETGFRFHGFFPREKRERVAVAEEIKTSGGVHVFFESPQRIDGALEVLSEVLPEAELVVGRELTKKFETIYSGTPKQVKAAMPPEEERGEFVVALRWPRAHDKDAPSVDPEEVLRAAADSGASHKVLTAVGRALGMSKNDAYDRGLLLLGKSGK